MTQPDQSLVQAAFDVERWGRYPRGGRSEKETTRKLRNFNQDYLCGRMLYIEASLCGRLSKIEFTE